MTSQLPTIVALVLLASLPSRGFAQSVPPASDWTFTRLDEIGGHKTTLVGSPSLADTPAGKAAVFTGDIAIFLDTNPLAGLNQFTAEIVFQPAASGGKEQRFLHFQEAGTENRLLFELRLIEGNRWFLDTFIKSGTGNYTQFAEKFPHPVGPWYHAAVTMDGTTMRHYVNGIEEMATPISYTPQKTGQTSIGVRINKVSWYTGLDQPHPGHAASLKTRRIFEALTFGFAVFFRLASKHGHNVLHRHNKKLIIRLKINRNRVLRVKQNFVVLPQRNVLVILDLSRNRHDPASNRGNFRRIGQGDAAFRFAFRARPYEPKHGLRSVPRIQRLFGGF